MKLDEFVRLVRSEKPRSVSRAVPSGGLSGACSLGAPNSPVVVYRHVLGAPVSESELRATEDRLGLKIPADLVAMLRRFDGVHLWAGKSGRAYEGLAPISEWRLAREAMYGTVSGDDPPDNYIALSYHVDGAAFAVLDVSSGRYFLMDSAGPDESTPIGENVEGLLDWLWASRIEPQESHPVEEAL